MTTLTDRLNAIRRRAEAAYRFPASTSKQAASAADVLPLLAAVEAVQGEITELEATAQGHLNREVQQLASTVARRLNGILEEKLGGAER